MTSQRFAIRVVAAFALVVLGAGGLAGCSTSTEGAAVTCSTSDCTVTFDRGVDASASVLGIDVKLVSVEGQNVKVEVAGNEVTVPVDGSQEAGGLKVAVDKVTDKQVVLKVSKA
jgi:hypothetical protein